VTRKNIKKIIIVGEVDNVRLHSQIQQQLNDMRAWTHGYIRQI